MATESRTINGVTYYRDPASGGWYTAGPDGATYWVTEPNQAGGGTLVGGQRTAHGGVGGAPAIPAPAPDPYQDWLSGDTGSRSYRYFGDDLKQYYEQHPDEAYRQYLGSEFGDRQTPLADYARGQYSDYWAKYIQASEADPTGAAGWTNYLTNNLAGQIRNSFNLQSPGQKGYSLMFQPAGRVTGF